jgi:hypothetical protein
MLVIEGWVEELELVDGGEEDSANSMSIGILEGG